MVKDTDPLVDTSAREPSDDDIRRLLQQAKTIAVVGLSPKPDRDSHQVSRFLQSSGYRIVPVHPQADEILGEPVYRSLIEIPFPIDLVDVFRRADLIQPVMDDVIQAKAPAVWLQLGIRNDGEIARAQRNGIIAVQDRCILVEHRRLLRAVDTP